MDFLTYVQDHWPGLCGLASSAMFGFLLLWDKLYERWRKMKLDNMADVQRWANRTDGRMQKIEQEAAAAKKEAATAKQEAAVAKKANEECIKAHKECTEEHGKLKDRVQELENLSGVKRP